VSPYPPSKDLFLYPRSVVFVGLPRNNGPGFLNPIDNLIRWGFRGTVHLVHPHAREIAGFPTIEGLSMLEGPADLAVVSAPRETVPEIIGQCAQKGIRAIVVTNQGFADADSRGRELQRLVVEEARRSGVRILGPNTLGIVNAFHRFTTSFMPLERQELAIGAVCQSGVFVVDAKRLTGGMGIGVDIANGCDVGLADALEWLGSEAAIRVIALHAEGIPEGGRFLTVARRISGTKPIVALKTGRSWRGARAAVSHTGSLCGEDQVADVALRMAGVLRVDETQDMADLVRGLLVLPPMRGPRVAVVTFTGGGGIILLDFMERWGLEPTELATSTLDVLQEVYPPWLPPGNPMDIWPAIMKHGMERVYGLTLKAALMDPSVDGVLCVALGLPPEHRARLDSIEVIQGLSGEFDKPIVVWPYGEEAEEAHARLTERGRAFAVPTLERGVRLLGHMSRYERWKRLSGGSFEMAGS
jgi:acetate---CoA ligase (ADP-forming)